MHLSNGLTRRGWLEQSASSFSWRRLRSHGVFLNQLQPRPSGAPLRFVLFGLSLALLAAPSASADVVHFTSPTNRQARTRLSGTVLEYTGREIVVETSDGRQFKRPGNQVVAIDTEWPKEVAAGDGLFAQGDFSQARKLYAAAIDKEKRAWARRSILAKIIRCYREMNRVEAAGKLFLGLVGEDPDTPEFALIPLAWLPAEPPPSLAQAAQTWLNSSNSPASVLLGASYLLPTARRGAAIDQLELLAGDKDRRIAALAQAQSWRGELATVREEQVARWQRNFAQFPEELRAGPYLVLGQALARLNKSEQAALTLLHVPILYPGERQLSAAALRAAAQLLERANQPAAATRLYQELTASYAGLRAADEAAQELERLQSPAGEAAPAPAASGDEPEERFLDGLRGRRLFELAENYCRTELSASGLSDQRRAEMTIELSRTYVEHALQSLPDERESYWTQALTVVEELLRSRPSDPRRVLLEVQLGLVRLARGELTRQEAEVLAGSERRLEQAREELRAAVAHLQSAKELLVVELRKANLSKRTEPGRLSANELLSLERNLNYQLARAFRNQGQSYPPRSDDRANSLRQAVEQLQPLAEVDFDDAVAWQSRLDEVTCERLLENFPAAQRRLDALDQREPPPRIEAGARAEAIRLALARNQLGEALKLVELGRAVSGEYFADLDYACFETYAAAWRAADKAKATDEAEQYQNQAVELIQDIDRRWGPYWSRRAETLLAGNVSASTSTKDVSVLLRAAESFYRAGRVEQALATYDQAAKLAAELMQPEAAFDAAYTAAVLEQEAGHYRAAADRFRRLSLAMPQQAKAGSAHLLAIYNHAQAAKTETATSDDDYLALLNEHLEHWSDDASANQARLWLGKLQERRRDWTAAIDAYQGVAIDDSHFAEAIAAIARSYKTVLAELQAAGKPTAETAEQAARWFEELITGGNDRLPDRFSPTERLAAVAAAELYLQYAEGRYDRAERILAAALAASPDAPEEWRSEVEGLLVFALAGQGQRDEAAARLNRLAQGRPQQLLLLIEGLGRIARQSTPAVRTELAALELQAADLLRAQGAALSADDRKAFDLAYAQALAAAGRRDEALKLLAGLAETSPRDGNIQEAYAQLLLDGPDKTSWQAALAKWRAIEKKCRPGSDRWLRSIYSQALALERLGQKTQALQLIKLTAAQHPGLGGAELKQKFLELQKRCKAQKR